MLQLDPNGTQHKKFQGWTNGQTDKVPSTPFPGSDLGTERAESDNEFVL